MDELLGWCVVANVATGLKHFSPGTKTWVLPPQWGDGGEQVVVVGRHRGTPGRLAQMVVPRAHLADFRVRGVYQPAVHRALTKQGERGEPRQWKSREEAEEAAGRWGLDAIVRAGVRRPQRRLEFFGDVTRLMAGESASAIRDVVDPDLPLGLGEVFRDRREVEAVTGLRELLDTIETAGTAHWARNPLWPVVRSSAAELRALLSRVP
ncbi:hypothetical protein [Lentzea cavernae]|uniref:hypothetical protein n=1 Tax=Lentzea cavernae TaxID=2020703 RepID=UPI00174B479F|nr:hypothetical protein [Lentzea cavernae]